MGCLPTEHSGLFIWQRLGRLRPRRSTQPTSNSWCSQQHFLFLPKVDRVALALSPLEATWRTKPATINKTNVLVRGDRRIRSADTDTQMDGKLLTVRPPAVGVGLPIRVVCWYRAHQGSRLYFLCVNLYMKHSKVMCARLQPRMDTCREWCLEKKLLRWYFYS